MATQNRRAGTIYFKVDGYQYDAKGDFTYNLGNPKREGIIGADGIHGFKETPQLPYIEGKLTDKADLDLDKLTLLDDVTVTLELANGKVITGANMWYAADGNGSTGEAELDVRFEGKTKLEEI
ncbi:phage tail tube protein [Jeongeupia naejangsanensis]|uniref:Phage tail tube protein n=1 Tax=Jeongeupia naejangsanensis TaxID=613195 RepID=A0ABS2BF96_9NEIS|nr:phage tail tube protein [Jeongeupia naejangsanensis]MBM3114279.1 phage tail tube protein [Jeongeupia naejangsanensis]